MRPRLYLLIGPKGSGKTYIGRLVEERLGIPFLRVEALAQEVRQGRPVTDPAYAADVFGAIEAAVRSRLAAHRELVIESLGVGEAFDGMLEALRRDAEVVLIRVTADPARCLARVRGRDGREHVDVSDAQVEALNAAVLARSHPFAGTLDNDDATPASLLAAFATIREPGSRPAG